jgi:hypothetical protein
MPGGYELLTKTLATSVKDAGGGYAIIDTDYFKYALNKRDWNLDVK